MQKVFGVELHLPEGKLPGYYAQIVKGIADAAPLLDRDKTLLFVAAEEDAAAVETFVSGYNVTSERSEWIAVDESWAADERQFTDFGVITRSGRFFIDARLGAVVALYASAPDSELQQAALQAEEHAFARKQETARLLLAVGRHHTELIEGIARAYRCQAEVVL